MVFWTHRGETAPDNDATQQDWIEWMAATFPAEVCQNFVLLPVYPAGWTVGCFSMLAENWRPALPKLIGGRASDGRTTRCCT